MLTNTKFGEKWDYRFMKLARDEIATWSKDPSTKVGAVIVTQERKIISTGYNGLPEYMLDSEEILNNRELKYRYIIHAEQNALDNAVVDVEGSILYVTAPCCAKCAEIICDRGISEVVWQHNEEFAKRWNTDEAIEIFKKNEVIITILK